MRIELTDISAVKKTLEIEVDAETVQQETDEVVRGYARQARIPGFRQGKAPLPVIRKRFAKEVREEVRERLVSRLYREATEEKGLRPVGGAVLDEVSDEPGSPFRFKTTLEVLPEFTVKDYRGVEARRPKVEVTDAEVRKTLGELRESRTRLVSEEGKSAATGDVLVADVKGEPEGGEPFEQDNTMLEVGATQNLPAFNDKLLGAEAGAQLQFAVDYPAEFPAEALAGKTVSYEIKVKEVKRRELPELDDDFAKDLGDFENLAALESRIRDDLTARKEAEAKRAVEQAVLDKLLLANPIVLPEALVEEELKHRLEDMVRGMVMQGLDPRQMEIDWKELRSRQEEPARKGVHARLLLDAVARDEPLGVENAEIEERLRAEAARAGEKIQALRSKLQKSGGMEALKNQMLREKALDLLTATANIQEEES